MFRHRISFRGPLALTVALAACCLVLPLRAQTPAPLSRVAIVPGSEDQQLSTLADLLIVSMARASQRYEMVERAELKRIEQEAEVQRMNIAERPRALARLAKADGLVLLTLEEVDPLHRGISARLSSTASGLIQATVTLPAGDKDLPMAAKLAAEALQHSAERLSTAGNTPKHIVSLLGIRAAVHSTPSIALETTLNAAVTHHIGRIPGFAVVERWKLDDVAFERSLSEKDMPALATGTTLVDGSFELKAGAVVMKVRVRNSEKDAGKTLVVEGPSENAFALAQAIASKVAAECGSHAAPSPWDARAEAAAYAKLGEWLISQRMGIEAAQAYESAVALGDRSAESLVNRIKAYALVSSPIIGIDNATYQLRGSALASHLERKKKHAGAVVISATRAVAYCQDFAVSARPPLGSPPSNNSVNLLEDTALMACRVLNAAHKLKVHVEQPRDVAALRQQTEALVKIVEQREGRFGSRKLAVCAGYWTATPEQAEERWREFLNPDLLPADLFDRRGTVAGHPINFLMMHGQPVILDWTTPDNSLGSAAWQRLISQLSVSKSLLNQADAIALSTYAARMGAQRDKLQLQYIELMERNRAALAQPQGQALLYAYDPVSSYPTLSGTWERYASLFASTFADSAVVDFFALEAIHRRIGRFQTDRQFLQPSEISKEAAARLLKTITDYSRRTGTAGSPQDYPGWGCRGPDELARLLISIFRDLNDAPPAQPAGDAVPVRYLHLLSSGDPADPSAWVDCRSMTRLGDRLIVSRQDRKGFFLIGGDLAKEVIPPFPGDEFPIPNLNFFPVKDGFLYLRWERGLWHYGYQDQKWSEVPGVPRQENQIMAVVDDTFFVGRPYLTGGQGHTIGRVKAGNYELIASSRRHPAEHPVDALPPSSVHGLFSAANGRPYALLTYANSQTRSGRCELHDLELKKRVALLHYYTRAIRDGANTLLWDSFMLALVEAGSETPRVLIRIPTVVQKQDDLPQETVWDWPASEPPRWPPSKPYIRYYPLIFHDRLFFLKLIDSLGVARSSEADGFSLLCFQPGTRNAVEIPLSYRPTEAMKSYAKGGKPPALVRPFISSAQAVATPTGIFFGPDESPGLLYVTWADVDEWLANHSVAAKSGATGSGATPLRRALDAGPGKP